jgi:NAD+ diphosphatase
LCPALRRESPHATAKFEKTPMMDPTLRTATRLDRQAHLRGDDVAMARLRNAPEARFLIMASGRPATASNADRTETHIRWFTAAEISAFRNSAGSEHAVEPGATDQRDAVFLGVERGTGAPRFAIALSEGEGVALADQLKPITDLRSLATQGIMTPEEVSLLGNAKSLADWHAASGFCSRCGTASAIRDGGWRRVCPSCGFNAFPRTDPVVIMLITDGERCVITRESRFPEGMYSVPAGYVEPGEDIEHAVIRETQEELGILVGDVRYHLSQPWPFPHSLMIGCFAKTAPVDLRRDPTEIDDARWVGREELASMVTGTHPEGLWVPGSHAIAHSLIQRWLTATSALSAFALL